MRIQNDYLSFILSVMVVLRVFGAGAANAESAMSKSTALALNVEEALVQALRHNPVLKAEKERLAIDHARLEQAKRVFQVNPELSLDADYRRRKFALPSGKTGTDFELRLLQEIEISGQAQHRIDAAKNTLKASRWQLMDSERRLGLQVRQRFYHLLILQEKKKVLAQRLSLHEDLFKIGIQRFEQEDISILEIDTLRFDRDQARQDLKKIESEKLEIARKLAVQLALSRGTTLLVRGDLRALSSEQKRGEGLSFEALEKCVLQHRPDLKAAELALLAQNAALRLAKSRSTPNLSLGPLYKIDNEDKVIGLSFNMPLPLFNRNQEEVSQARAHRNINQNKLTAKKIEIARDADAIYQHFHLAKTRFDFFGEDYLKQLSKKSIFPRRAYDAGEISIFEFSIAQARLTAAHLSYLDALLALLKAKAELDAQLIYCVS